MRKIKKRKDKIIAIVSIAVMVLSVLSVTIVCLMNTRLFDESEGGIVSQPDHIAIPNEIKDKYMNFLIVGLDESERLTDIIMIASLDVEKKTIRILQIPRDSYVGIGSTGKINEAYNNGDSELSPINRLVSTINTQYALPISHYVTVTLEAFRGVVDAMGGIKINMPYTIHHDNGIVIEEGEQVLNGDEAEALVRHRRSYAEADIGRIKALRIFVAAAFAQAKEMGIGEVTGVAKAAWGDFTTDLTINEILTIANVVIDVDMADISMHMVPGEGVSPSDPLNTTGLSIWSMHKQETADLLNEYFRPYSDPVEADDLAIKEIKNSTDWYSDENTKENLEDVIEGDGKSPSQLY